MSRLRSSLSLGWMPLAAAAALAFVPASALAYDTPPTEIMQDVDLVEGSEAGIVKLSAKGGFGGDVVAVDVDGARIPKKPVRLTVRIEFHGQQPDGTPWPATRAASIAQQIQSRLGTLKGSDGTPVSVQVVGTARSDAQPATPGFHQIELRDIPPGSEPNFVDRTTPANGVKTGMFGDNEPVERWAHETLHILGFPDRYLALSPFAVIKGQRYPLPPFKGDKTSQKQLDAWSEKLDAAEKALEQEHGGKAERFSGIPAGHDDDLLANPLNPNATLPAEDVDRLVARAGVHLHVSPGDLLLSKDTEHQNLGVGAGLDLYAPYGGKDHADGIWAYCIDLERHSPAAGTGYDVLGQAGALGTAQTTALQAILTRIGNDPDAHAYGGPEGAQGAVWAVTDGASALEESQELTLLSSAGVTYDEATKAAFRAGTHFTDPNAGSPDTAAVTTGGVLPAVAADRTPRGTIESELQAALKPLPLRIRAQPTTKLRKAGASLNVAVLLDGTQDAVTVSIRRIVSGKGKKKKKPAIVLGTQIAPLGSSTLHYALPKLIAGKYRFVATGASGWTRAKTIELTKAKARKKRH